VRGFDEDYLRGTTPRIPSRAAMVKTTPSSFVRAQEQSRDHGELEPHSARALDRLREVVDTRTKDWSAFQGHAVEFHLRNATAWANEATGHDLAAQVDPEFEHGPAALAARA